MEDQTNENPIKPEENLQTKIFKEIISAIKILVFAALLAYGLNHFVLVNAMVPTGSMEPTIMTGDRVIAFRHSYLFSDPNRLDIVVFDSPTRPDMLYIKRIIGLPGEEIFMENGNVYINGELLDDASFTKEPFRGTHGPFFVGESQFFVLGDNRNNSEDSRFWANPFIPQEDIVGRAIFKYFRGVGLL